MERAFGGINRNKPGKDLAGGRPGCTLAEVVSEDGQGRDLELQVASLPPRLALPGSYWVAFANHLHLPGWVLGFPSAD